MLSFTICKKKFVDFLAKKLSICKPMLSICKPKAVDSFSKMFNFEGKIGSRFFQKVFSICRCNLIVLKNDTILTKYLLQSYQSAAVMGAQPLFGF